MATEIVEIQIREKGARATSNAIRNVGRNSRTSTTAVRALATALAAIGATRVVRNLLDTADAAIRMSNQLRAVTTSTEQFNAVQSRLTAISNNTRAPIEETVSLFRRLSVATRDLGTSQEDILKVTEGLTAAIGVAGATAAEGSNALIQLAQGLASGRLGGDELRSVLENLPTLAQALSDELGVTVGQLREMGAAGALTADVVFPALLRASAGFQAQLAELPFTLEQAQVVLTNTFQTVIGEIDATLGATTALSGGVITLAEGLRGVLVDAAILAVRASGTLLETLSGLNSLLNQIGVESLPTIGQQLRLFGQIGQVVFDTLEAVFASALVGLAAFGAGVAKVLDAVGVLEEGTLALRNAEVAAAQGLQADLFEDAAASARKLAEIQLEIARNAGGTGEAAQNLLELSGAATRLEAELLALKTATQPDFDLTAEGPNLISGGEAPTSPGQLTGLKTVIRLTDQLRILDQKRIEPLDAQLEKLRQQGTTLIAAAKAANDLELASEGLLLIGNQVAAIERDRSILIEQQAIAQREIVTLIEQAAAISPELATQIQLASDAAVAAGGGLAEVNSQLGKIAKEAQQDIEDANQAADFFSTTLGRGVERGIGQAVRGALTGEGIDAAKIFSQIAGDLLTESLTGALKGAISSLTSGIGGAGAGGGGLAAGITAGIAAGGLVLAGALKDTSATISNDLIQSAATESGAAATRGVIAGPTNIPIFQVGQQLEAALISTNEILTDILIAVRGDGTTDGGGFAAAASFETSTPNLT